MLASLSLATDLGTGQSLGHGMRTSLLAVQLARHMGLDDGGIRAVQQVSLLRFLGCTADSGETAELAGGDERSFNAALAPVLNGSQIEGLWTLTRVVGSGQPPLTRTRKVVVAIMDSDEPAKGLAAHCEVAAMLARRLGLHPRVSDALLAGYERWDGMGYPHGLEGDAIPVEIRISMVARDIDLFATAGRDSRDVLRKRRGKAYDPVVVDATAELVTIHPEADWHEVLDAEPEPVDLVEDLDSALEVMADFADLKSPWTRGHSREVARLAKAAAQEAGLGPDVSNRLWRAGLVHDLGRVGVANGIWDKSGPLATDEHETVQLHSYLTDRILSRCSALADLGSLASSHHERLDGSGYHRHATADQLSNEVRLLAAADVFAALTAARPHRPAHSESAAVTALRIDADHGRLDSRAVESVIAAAGGEARSIESSNPAGLTDREVEVLRQLCLGRTNRQVAGELFISPKTVGRHVENIYAKIGVSTRAGAAVYAMEHGLLG